MHIKIYGEHEQQTVNQLYNCMKKGNVVGGILCADGHYGYSQPVGGVVAYVDQISPSGVGYDIACGNKAVKTNIQYEDIKQLIPTIMDDIANHISFGIGRKNKKRVDHELFEDDDWHVFKAIGTQEHDRLKKLALDQLGTVGAGNHFVDLFVEEKTGAVWVANHFGSRGFGHRTASGFLNLANNRKFSDKAPGESMDQLPTVLDLQTELGEMYFRAMTLAGKYAYAGRDYVMDEVLTILQAEAQFTVHNHHNFAWKERHLGQDTVVVRKGATPSAPGQLGFIGGSMGDISVIVEGKENVENIETLHSTVHGAGRIMSRTKAAGRMNWKTKERSGGEISQAQMDKAVHDFGVELRGGGTDESPFVYRKLATVLEAHKKTVDVLHVLKPIGVCMAGANEFDPYKD